VFKEFHGTVANIESCKEAIKIILSTKGILVQFIYDVLVGIISTIYRVDNRYNGKIGGKISGVIPGAIWNAKEQASTDGTVVYFMRDNKES